MMLSADVTALIVATPQPFNMPAVTIVDITGVLPCRERVLPLRTEGGALWHHSLERFGAAQLNDRFHSAGITPDDQAWLGWFAVKLLWEAGVRGRSPRDMSYDGHKGTALRFNAAGALLQPVYVIEGDRVVRELRPDDAVEPAACAH
jgi:hypothetical protein